MVTFALIISILGLIFVPLSPLTIISSLLLLKLLNKLDSENILSKKKLFASMVITIVIGLICTMVAYMLPYSGYYPVVVRRLFESVGVINIFFITKIFITKNL